MTDYDLGTARGSIEIDASGVGEELGNAGDAVDDFTGTLDGAAPSMSKFATGLTIAGVSIGGAFAVAVKGAVDYEARLSAIQAVSGATKADMEGLSNKALQLGKDTKYSASEAATAIEELVKAGLSVPDVMNGAADATVALAAAGEVALPAAAEMAADAMNSFGLTAKDMPKVVDDIAGAANASSIDVSQLGESLKQVGAVAHLVGMSFHDTSVAIAEMGKAGIKGGDAGTSLKSFLSNLIPTSKEQVALFEELGFSAVGSSKAMKKLADMGIKPASKAYDDVSAAMAKYVEKSGGGKAGTAENNKAVQALGTSTGALKNQLFQANGEAKSLKDMQILLAEKTKNMSKEQKLAAFNVLFGSDAIRAASIMAENGAKGYDTVSGAMGKVTAAEVAATRQDNVAGKWDALKGSAETLGIMLGQVLLPIINSVVEKIIQWANWFVALDESTKKGIVVVGLFVAGALIFIGVVYKVNMAIKALKLSIIAMNLAMRANPAIFICTLIALLIAALVTLYKNNDQFRNGVDKVWNGIKTIIGNVVSFVVGTLFRKIMNAWTTVVGKLLEGAAWVAEKLGLPFAEGLRNASNSFNTMAETADKKLEEIANSASTWGDKTTEMYAAGLLRNKALAAANAAIVASGVGKKLVIYDGKALGSDITQEMADGIAAKTVVATDAAAEVARLVKASLPIPGQKIGMKAAEDMAAGIKAARGRAKDAADDLAFEVQKSMTGDDWAAAGVTVGNKYAKGILRKKAYAEANAAIVASGVGKKLELPSAKTLGMNMTSAMAKGIKEKTAVAKAAAGWVNYAIKQSLPIKGAKPIGAKATADMAAGIASLKKQAATAASDLRIAVEASMLSVEAEAIGFGFSQHYADGIRKGMPLILTASGEAAWAAAHPIPSGIPGFPDVEIPSRLPSAPKNPLTPPPPKTPKKATPVDPQIAIDAARAKKDRDAATKARNKEIAATAKRNRATAAKNAKNAAAASARVLKSVRAFLGKGLASGIAGTAEQVKSASAKLGEMLHSLAWMKSKRDENAGAILKKQSAAILAQAKLREKVAVQLAAARDKLSDAIKLRDDFSKSVKDGMDVFGSISKIDPSDGNEVIGRDILEQLQARLAAAKKFVTDMATIRAAGLNDTAYKQLLDAGPEGAADAAAALAAGGKTLVTSVNGLQKQIGAQGAALGKAASKDMYQAGVDTAQGIVNGLVSQTGKLKKAAEKLARSLITAVKKALGIHSPSTVTYKDGFNTAQGLINGILSQRKNVAKAMQSLVTMPDLKMPTVGTIPVSGAGRPQPSVSAGLAAALEGLKTGGGALVGGDLVLQAAAGQSVESQFDSVMFRLRTMKGSAR